MDCFVVDGVCCGWCLLWFVLLWIVFCGLGGCCGLRWGRRADALFARRAIGRWEVVLGGGMVD